MRVAAEKVGTRIHLRSESPVAGLKRKVPGAYFSSRNGWTFPLSMDVCRNLREVFGKQLEVGVRLSAWAREEIAREESQGILGRSLSGVGLTRVPEVAPDLWKVLSNRPYQASAARFIAEGRQVLIADTPGLGKTTEAIAGIVESGVEGPYLIVAPKTALPTWEREIQMRLGEAARPVVVTGSRPERNAILERALDSSPADAARLWLIINIEMVRTKSFWVCPDCGEEWKASDHPKANVVDCGHEPKRVRTRHDHEYGELFGFGWGAIIADECQRSLIRTSGTPTQTRAGMKMLESTEDGLRIALSGTPMRGKPQRLWGTLNWLDESRNRGFWQWLERYWVVTQDGYAGARNIGEFRQERTEAFHRSLDRMMIRRTKAEVSPELPPKAYMGSALDPDDPSSPVAVWLPMTPEQSRAYKAMAKHGSAEVEGGDLDAVGILAEITRMKQFATSFMKLEQQTRHVTGEREATLRKLATQRGQTLPAVITEEITVSLPQLPSNKLDWIEQFLLERNILDGDEKPTSKVVIVSQFTEMLGLFANTLQGKYPGFRYAAVTGKVTGKKRQENIDVFNDIDSGVQVMLLNTIAGGVAVTLDSADDMIFVDETYIPDDQEQAEERINNRRPEEKIIQRCYWYLKSLETIDEGIARTNYERDRDQKFHLDDRRGIAYLRAVYATLEEIHDRTKKGKA
jgi:SNF2 family DNA or RNA helicase